MSSADGLASLRSPPPPTPPPCCELSQPKAEAYSLPSSKVSVSEYVWGGTVVELKISKGVAKGAKERNA